MVSSSTRNSAAQPCTSPMANTVSPPRANGAGFHSEISTGSARAVSMRAMLALSGAALHCGPCHGSRGAALELFLDRRVEVEAPRGAVAPGAPEMGAQGVVGIADALDPDVGAPQHPLV